MFPNYLLEYLSPECIHRCRRGNADNAWQGCHMCFRLVPERASQIIEITPIAHLRELTLLVRLKEDTAAVLEDARTKAVPSYASLGTKLCSVSRDRRCHLWKLSQRTLLFDST